MRLPLQGSNAASFAFDDGFGEAASADGLQAVSACCGLLPDGNAAFG
jgi:hypothetical protein